MRQRVALKLSPFNHIDGLVHSNLPEGLNLTTGPSYLHLIHAFILTKTEMEFLGMGGKVAGAGNQCLG